MSQLSGIFATDQAGLPRGRTARDHDHIREQQQRRIVRGAISAFAKHGYAATTITDIVKNARVSRQAFYEIFSSKEACFLAAEALGRQALQVDIQAVSLPTITCPDQWVRQFIRAYLQLCSAEPEFSRAWAIEFPNASALTLQQRNAFFEQLAHALQQGHQTIRQLNSQPIPTFPAMFYDLAVGGAYEMVYRQIAKGQFEQLQSLEDVLVQFILHTLGEQPRKSEK